jgi:translation initiation factor 3 subunit E
MVEALYTYAKFQYECGNYDDAANYLFHYRLLSSQPDRVFSALWGKFACEILLQNWENALEDLRQLREGIDAKVRFRCLFFFLFNRVANMFSIV